MLAQLDKHFSQTTRNRYGSLYESKFIYTYMSRAAMHGGCGLARPTYNFFPAFELLNGRKKSALDGCRSLVSQWFYILTVLSSHLADPEIQYY